MRSLDPTTLAINIGLKVGSVAVPIVLIGAPAIAGGVAARVDIEKRQGPQDPNHALRSTANAPMSSIVPLAEGAGLMVAGIAGFNIVGKSKANEIARTRQSTLAGDLAAIGQAQLGHGSPKAGSIAAQAAKAGQNALGSARALGRIAGHWGSAFALAGGAGVLIGAAGMGSFATIPYDAVRTGISKSFGIPLPELNFELPSPADIGKAIYDATSIKTTTKIDKQVEIAAGSSTDVLSLLPLPEGMKITGYKEEGGVTGGTTISEFLHSTTSIDDQIKAHNAQVKDSVINLAG